MNKIISFKNNDGKEFVINTNNIIEAQKDSNSITVVFISLRFSTVYSKEDFDIETIWAKIKGVI